LEALSIRLIKEPQLCQSISAAATMYSAAFTVSEFLARMDSIIERIMIPGDHVVQSSDDIFRPI
jgi:hypothetical protein